MIRWSLIWAAVLARCQPGCLTAFLKRSSSRSTPIRCCSASAGPGDASTPIRFAELDLAQPGWSSALALDRQADAAVSTTALHWLSGESLTTMYAEVAKFLRPGGVLLDGDHLREDKQAAPTLHRLGRALIDRQEQRVARDHTAQTWEDWWDAVKRDPDLAGLVAERESALRQSDHHGSAAGRLDVHVAALRAAGFDEIGTLWQYGDNRLLCAIRS